MVDREVTDILEEIRSRVRATAELSGGTTVEKSNGDRTDSEVALVLPPESPNKNNYSSLTVLARAWDRLPPLVSNRQGVSARLELWIKAKLKTALRWITWEQVNFNAATHQTFLELIESLSLYEERLSSLQHQLQSQLKKESAALQDRIDAQQRAIDTQRADLLTEMHTRQDQISRQQVELNELLLKMKTQLQSSLDVRLDDLKLHASELSRMQTQLEQRIEDQNAGAQSQLTTLIQEFRERDERLLDEQRVCLRQLSLELAESQVLQDRSRRELESRVTKLESPKPK